MSEHNMPDPDKQQYERTASEAGLAYVIGLDEVGRGSLAGPVAVGAVCIRVPYTIPPEGIYDSKQLTPKKREQLYPHLKSWAPLSGVGYASADEIDKHGILPAQRLATVRILQEIFESLSTKDSGSLPRPNERSRVGFLMDGSVDWIGSLENEFPSFDCTERILQPKLDMRSITVGAASIIAKVERDRLMAEAARQYPEFGWDKNAGYGTAQHREMIKVHGPTPLHRISWLSRILSV